MIGALVKVERRVDRRRAPATILASPSIPIGANSRPLIPGRPDAASRRRIIQSRPHQIVPSATRRRRRRWATPGAGTPTTDDVPQPPGERHPNLEGCCAGGRSAHQAGVACVEPTAEPPRRDCRCGAPEPAVKHAKSMRRGRHESLNEPQPRIQVVPTHGAFVALQSNESTSSSESAASGVLLRSSRITSLEDGDEGLSCGGRRPFAR